MSLTASTDSFTDFTNSPRLRVLGPAVDYVQLLADHINGIAVGEVDKGLLGHHPVHSNYKVDSYSDLSRSLPLLAYAS
jgi:hypothetical protein